MPLYTLTCAKGHTHDRICACGEEWGKCPKCGELALRKALELPAKRAAYHGIQK